MMATMATVTMSSISVKPFCFCCGINSFSPEDFGCYRPSCQQLMKEVCALPRGLVHRPAVEPGGGRQSYCSCCQERRPPLLGLLSATSWNFPVLPLKYLYCLLPASMMAGVLMMPTVDCWPLTGAATVTVLLVAGSV